MNNETQPEKDQKQTREDEGEQECPICFEKIQKYGFCVTNCNHQFCMNCMIEAMKKKKNCPLCRENMDPNPASVEETNRENLFAYNQGQEEGYVCGFIDGEIRGYAQFDDDREEMMRRHLILQNKYKKIKTVYELTMKQYHHSYVMETKYNTKHPSEFSIDESDECEEITNI